MQFSTTMEHSSMKTPLIAVDTTALCQLITDTVHEAIREAVATRYSALADPPPELLSRAQARRLLHVSNTTLHHWEKKRVLIPTRAGRRVLFRRVDIDRMLSGEEAR